MGPKSSIQTASSNIVAAESLSPIIHMCMTKVCSKSWSEHYSQFARELEFGCYVTSKLSTVGCVLQDARTQGLVLGWIQSFPCDLEFTAYWYSILQCDIAGYKANQCS